MSEQGGERPDGREAGRVVVGVDGSPGSLAALDWAVGEAARRDAMLHIVVVREEGDGGGDDREREEVANTRARDALRRVVTLDPHPERAMSSTPPGPAGPALLDASRGADLFVLGTTYLDSKPGPGDVTSYCVQHTHVPLVLVPAPVRS